MVVLILLNRAFGMSVFFVCLGTKEGRVVKDKRLGSVNC